MAARDTLRQCFSENEALENNPYPGSSPRPGFGLWVLAEKGRGSYPLRGTNMAVGLGGGGPRHRFFYDR